MRRAEVVGGGIAGLVASIMLARNGWTVRVHERSSALRASGNGFPIFENGLRVLEALDLAEDVCAHGVQLERFVIRRHTGENIVEYDPLVATGGRIVMFHRQALIDLLARAAVDAGVSIALASKVVGADEAGVLHLENGERATADLVVGADGIHSAVRRSVAGDLSLGKHRKGAIRLLIPIHPGDFPDGNIRVATEYNHPSGRRVGLMPCSADLMYMILVSLRTDTAAQELPVPPALWTESFPMLGKYFDRIGEMGHYDVYHSIFPPAWHFGRCALVGDAAHGMTPALGQGANTAMMTAYALGASKFGSESLSATLARWEESLRPLVNFTQKHAEEMTEGRLDPKNEVFFSDPALRPLLTADIPSMA